MNYPPEFYVAISSAFVFLTALAKIALHFSQYLFPVS